MLGESVGGAIVVGKLRGGKLKNLLDTKVNKWGLIVSACFIQSFAALIVSKEIEPLWEVVNNNVIWIQLIVYALLLWGVVANIRSKGFRLITLGIILNLIVIVANGGRMPVDIRGIEHLLSEQSVYVLQNAKSFTHIAASESTKALFLADIVHLKKPYLFPQSLSIGDIFMMMGIFIFLQSQIIKGKRRERIQ